MMGYRRFFLSYSNADGEITDITEQKLGEALRARYGDTFTITRYTHDENYNKNFRKLMDSIPEHDAMMSIISQSYLESPACMYEISSASVRDENGKLGFSIPYYCIVLSQNERKKFHSSGKIKDPELLSRNNQACRYYKAYWQKQLRSVEKDMKRETKKNRVTQKLQFMLEDTRRAESLIDDYLSYVCNTNHTSFTAYNQNGFSVIADDLVKSIRVPQYPEELPVNENFVENSGYREFVRKVNEERRVVFTGIPGSGKTEIIRQYIRNYGYLYRDVVCINCFSLTSMFLDIAAWCGARQYPIKGKIETVIEDFTEVAKQTKGVLFIFENVMNGNTDKANERGIKGIWNVFERIMTHPEIDSCFVAASNQTPTNPGLAKMLMDCGGLDKDEAQKLFFTALDSQKWDYTHIKDDPEGVDRLLTELGGNPLAILQAAYYIKSLNLSAEDYLKRLGEYPIDVDEEFTELFGGDERTVAEGATGSGLRGLCRSLRMVYDLISKENPLAKALLDRLSFMASAPVDEDFLAACVSPKPNITDYRRARNLLVDYRLITNSGVQAKSCECKDIVRVLVRSYHTEAENNELVTAVSAKMFDRFRRMKEDKLESREAQLLSSHAAYLLDNFGDAVTHRDDLLLFVGNGLFVLGSYSDSLDCFRRVDTSDPERAYKVNFALARSYEALSQNDKVIELYNQSLSSDVSPSRFACPVRMKQIAAFAYQNMEKNDDALFLIDEILNATEDGSFCANCGLCDRMRQRAAAYLSRGNIINDRDDGKAIDDVEKKFDLVKEQYEQALSCLGVDSFVKILDQQEYKKLKPHGLLAARLLINISSLFSDKKKINEAESFMIYAKRLIDDVCSNLFENSISLVRYYYCHGYIELFKSYADKQNPSQYYDFAVKNFEKCLDISMRCGFSETRIPFVSCYELGTIFSEWADYPENAERQNANLEKAVYYFSRMMEYKVDDRKDWIARTKIEALLCTSFYLKMLGRQEESEKRKKEADRYANEHGFQNNL